MADLLTGSPSRSHSAGLLAIDRCHCLELTAVWWFQPANRQTLTEPSRLNEIGCMKRLVWHLVVSVLVLEIAVTTGCAGTKTELELTTYDPAQDHQKIATYYRDEAAKLKQASEDMAIRIIVYERLFGPTSDWVTGTRLLVQSYEDAAKELERRARKHLELLNRPQTRSEAQSDLR